MSQGLTRAEVERRCNVDGPRDAWCSVHGQPLLHCVDERAAALLAARDALGAAHKRIAMLEWSLRDMVHASDAVRAWRGDPAALTVLSRVTDTARAALSSQQ